MLSQWKVNCLNSFIMKAGIESSVRFLFGFIFLLLFGMSMQIGAQTIITDRPDQTESSTTIPFKSAVKIGKALKAAPITGFADIFSHWNKMRMMMNLLINYKNTNETIPKLFFMLWNQV